MWKYAILAFLLGATSSSSLINRWVQVPQPPTPGEIIEAVNSLRLAYGLNPLSVHPVLMQVAQGQADALAGTEGSVGHARPHGITLGQQLIMLGYPLSGDLTLDGYRSENWVAAQTTDEAISFWLSDDLHTNTMLSGFRSDIGAGVAVSDQVYIVIDTALQTRSGQQQSEAYAVMTGIPLTQAAYSGSAAESPNSLLDANYINPVIRNTARPDGDVYHKVQYGQSLWSIAIVYGTTIKKLQAWNNLGAETILQEGQLLLVQRSATQPLPATNTPIPSGTVFVTHTSTQSAGFPTMTIQPVATAGPSEHGDSSSSLWVGILVVVITTGGFMSAWLIRSPK